MDLTALQNPTLPIVGVPMVAGGAQILVTVLCKCDPTNAPMIVAADQGVVCHRCRNIYAIGKAQYEAGKGGVMAMIHLVGKAGEQKAES